MKICNICKERESLPYGYKCRVCHCEYQKAYHKNHPQSIAKSHKARQKHRRDLIKERKNAPCFDCGVRYPWYVMDFDHVRGEKKFNLSIASNKMFSVDVINEEIEKCDLVCANCHRIRTFTRTQLPDSVTGNTRGSEPRNSRSES